MLTIDNSPALVKGAGRPEQPATELRTVTRAFMLHGERQEVGKVIELPWKQAREFDAMNKTGPAPHTTPEPGDDAKPKKGPKKP